MIPSFLTCKNPFGDQYLGRDQGSQREKEGDKDREMWGRGKGGERLTGLVGGAKIGHELESP